MTVLSKVTPITQTNLIDCILSTLINLYRTDLITVAVFCRPCEEYLITILLSKIS